MKEIPQTTERNWFGEKGKASKRLIIETAWMKHYFKIGEWHQVPTPRTNWDRNFQIFPTELKLHTTNDASYPLAWFLKFAMDDKEFLCNYKQIWTVKVFYPVSYPANEPVTSLLDSNGYIIQGGASRGNVNIAGINYNYACLYQSHAHNPGRDHAASYAIRSVEWLRSYLYSQKHGVSMPFYV